MINAIRSIRHAPINFYNSGFYNIVVGRRADKGAEYARALTAILTTGLLGLTVARSDIFSPALLYAAGVYTGLRFSVMEE